MNRIIAAIASLLLLSVSQSGAQLAGTAGAYSRMGFGARGIGMGNAMLAVHDGDIQGFYNPAVLPYADRKNLSATFGILAFDRRLNFISYSQPLPPEAGLSIAIVNSGVSEIDGRDSDGQPTGPLQTSENQAILSFSTRFKAGFSAGVNIKLLYYHLYTGITSVTVGIDAGIFVPISGRFSAAVAVRDINSKYKWDTSSLYGESGQSTTDKFPLLYAAGIAYRLPDSLGIVSAEVEASDQSTLLGRAGVEVYLLPVLTLRGGIDRVDLKEKGTGVRPSVGFTAGKQLEADSLPLVNPDMIAVNYTYVFEPFASSGMHLVSLTIGF